ncbi:hypothetical protein V1498_19770 [Peribacillus sp. SCS-26]|uniref:hypothetical protein n=1 Tax=Paraperibacillus marinus TaxID=3115295 RepID=UPI00390601A5
MITAWIGSAAFFAVAVLYILLALGLPYGDFAMGGRYKVMPRQMRVVCLISVCLQFVAILILLQAGHVIAVDALRSMATGACYVFAFYLTVNTIFNAFSKSKKERLVMTPLSLLTAICFLVTAMNS